ncbi:MAG: hypothetical protein ACE5J9_07760 [Methanosarcinales archaeon]
MQIQKNYGCNFIKDFWHQKAKYIITRLKTIKHTEIILDCVVNEVISPKPDKYPMDRDNDGIPDLQDTFKTIPHSHYNIKRVQAW